MTEKKLKMFVWTLCDCECSWPVIVISSDKEEAMQRLLVKNYRDEVEERKIYEDRYVKEFITLEEVLNEIGIRYRIYRREIRENDPDVFDIKESIFDFGPGWS